MKFGLIDPRRAHAQIVKSKDWLGVAKMVGIESGRTDCGALVRYYRGGGIGYFCYEFGLYVPVDKQHYFSVGNRLVAGAAVLYGFNEAGETVDLGSMPEVVFYRDAHEVEAAIRNGQIERPQIVVNKNVLWRWPDPVRHEVMIGRMRQHGTL
jgi:hypothetical protein